MTRHRATTRSASRQPATPSGLVSERHRTETGARGSAPVPGDGPPAEGPSRPRRRHVAARPAASTTSVARRIAIPAATVAVAGVVGVGGAVAFAAGSPPGAPRVPTTATPAPGHADQQEGGADAKGTAALGSPSAPVTGLPVNANSPVAGSVVAGPEDSAAITNAINHSDLTSLVPASAYRVVNIRISRTDPTWARAELLPVTDTVDRARGVLRRTASGWRLMQLGSYAVGCTIVPDQARADLALECPPAGANT